MASNLKIWQKQIGLKQPPSSGSGNGSVAVSTTAEYTERVARTTTITFQAANCTDVVRTVSLSGKPEHTNMSSTASSSAAGLYFTTRTSTRYISLCKGTLPEGKSVNRTVGSSSVTVKPEITDDLSGNWTRNDLDDIKILVYVSRSNSSPTSSYPVYVRGMDLIITYDEAIQRTLTIVDNGYDVTPKGSLIVYEGTKVAITVNEDPLPLITLDGKDITDKFTIVHTKDSKILLPSASSYVGLSSGSGSVSNAVGRGYNNPSSSTTCWYGGNNKTIDSCYTLYNFITTDVPNDATNIKVSCIVAGAAENSTYSHLASSGRYSVWALCSNGVLKSSLVYTTKTSTTTILIPETSFTRLELNDLQLRHYVGYYGGRTNGATVTITYDILKSGSAYSYELTISGDLVIVLVKEITQTLYVKVGSSFKKILKVYKKINNTWVCIDDVSSLFSSAINGNWSGYFRDI